LNELDGFSWLGDLAHEAELELVMMIFPEFSQAVLIVMLD